VKSKATVTPFDETMCLIEGFAVDFYHAMAARSEGYPSPTLDGLRDLSRPKVEKAIRELTDFATPERRKAFDAMAEALEDIEKMVNLPEDLCIYRSNIADDAREALRLAKEAMKT
jgi:hypothetical protein